MTIAQCFDKNSKVNFFIQPYTAQKTTTTAFSNRRREMFLQTQQRLIEMGGTGP